MKKMVTVLALTLAFAVNAMAADVISLPAKNGNVSFNHKQHQEIAKDCKKCHEKGPGKIEGFGKDAAHKLCKDCHVQKEAGPTTCSGCHKKN